MADRFPNELWLKALGYAPNDALTNIALTSHRFCDLSRPHIFAEFEFHPYAIGSAGVLLPTPRLVKKAAERLKFWLSDAIAPFVRVCNVTPVASKASKISTSDQPYILLDAFFQGIRAFTGLRALTTNEVHFTQTGLSNLGLLPNLHTLRIEEYKVGLGHAIDFDSLKFGNLRCLQIPAKPSLRNSLDHSRWIPLLSADKVCELELALNPPNGLDIDQIPSFPCTEKLSIYLPLSMAPQNLRILSKFPSLRDLSMRDMDRGDEAMHWDGSGLQQLVHSELPSLLNKYTGLFQTLPLVLPLPNLTDLTIEVCSPLDFLQTLRGMRAPKITSLTVAFMYLNSAVFEELCTIFSAVTRVKIRVVDAEGASENWDVDGFDPTDFDWKVPAILETFVSSLPASMKQLAVHWDMDFEFIDELPPFREFADAIMKKHRGLNALWLGIYGFTLRSLKSKGKIAAKEDLVGEHDPHDVVKRIANDFKSSWEILGGQF
ncbi:hypothetical protein B0H16DRAFT_1888040 [Mycena metata]|uniref:F-box domain-containing protein n=1 Tax=Mycena metata TaxID=1033252 RepID=A0AAD7IVK9_9AGAR|nr:hypothetical protein B0H16DRAFT_1888040 [Mycena metata]